MINTIEKNCIDSIKSKNFSEVYGFYDNIDIREKSNEIFIVVGMGNLTAGTVIPDTDSTYYNFTAQIIVIVYAAKGTLPETLYNTVQAVVIPAIAAVYKISGFEINQPEWDKNLVRFKLETVFRICGTYNIH